MQTATYGPKKIIAIIAAGLVIILAGVLLYQFLTTAKITITTSNSSNYVSIIAMKSGVLDTTHSKEGLHQLSAKVKLGTYELAATSQTSSITRVIQIRGGQTLSFTLNPVGPSALEPVYGSTVSGLVANSSNLLFLNSGNILTTIDAQNNVTTLLPGEPMYGIQWGKGGVGIARDTHNNLYVISNNTRSPLKLPFVPNPTDAINYAISQSGSVYVSQGKVIYKGDISGNFKKLYNSKYTIANISAGVNKIAAVIITEKNSPDNDGAVAVINDSGKAIQGDFDVNNVSWSPGGSYLLASSESQNLILDANLHQKSTVPSNETSVFAWENDHSLYYNFGGTLWNYSLGSQQSSKITTTPSPETINGIYPSTDGSYVYISAQTASAGDDSGSNSPGTSRLYRVGLQGQTFNNSLAGLSVFLPETVSGCSLNYVVFTAPTVTAQYATPDLNPTCSAKAQSELQYNGLDPSQFQFQLSQFPAGQ